tara:strand:+ start:1181 stop:1636 length:456 start_codon:yes stop_codon:yes gene_type:complete
LAETSFAHVVAVTNQRNAVNLHIYTKITIPMSEDILTWMGKPVNDLSANELISLTNYLHSMPNKDKNSDWQNVVRKFAGLKPIYSTGQDSSAPFRVVTANETITLKNAANELHKKGTFYSKIWYVFWRACQLAGLLERHESATPTSKKRKG